MLPIKSESEREPTSDKGEPSRLTDWLFELVCCLESGFESSSMSTISLSSVCSKIKLFLSGKDRNILARSGFDQYLYQHRLLSKLLSLGSLAM